jgi:hypothetical protein
MRRDLVLSITGVAVLLLSSCGSATKSVAMAEESVQQFHSQLDAQQYAAAYAASDEKLHQASTESDFEKLLRSVHTKLGNVRDAKLQNRGVAWFAGQGATVTLVYNTKFAEGSGTEQFVWHIKDSHPTLYGYHINSNDLIEK